MTSAAAIFSSLRALVELGPRLAGFICCRCSLTQVGSLGLQAPKDFFARQLLITETAIVSSLRMIYHLK